MLVAWDDEQAASLPALADKAAANGYRHDRGGRRGDGARARAAPRRRRHRRHARARTSTSSTRGRTPLAFATEAVANGATLLTGFQRRRMRGRRRRRPRADGRRRARGAHPVRRQRRRAARRHARTACSASTASPCGRAAASSSCSTSWRGRCCRARSCPVPTDAHQGRARGPDRVRQRDARPDRRRHRRQGRHRVDPRRASTACSRRAAASCPALLDEEVTAVYAGLRAATEHSDYQLAPTPTPATCASAASAPPASPRRWRSPRRRSRC